VSVFALTAEYVAIAGVDQSANFKSAVLTVDAAQLDTTDFASAGWTEMIGGLKSGTLALTVQDDVTNSAIDDVLWGFLGTVQTFEIRPTQSAVGSNNPKYTGSVLITSHSMGGQVGDLATKQLSFPTSGAVARAEA
jgi:hypothetical protein